MIDLKSFIHLPNTFGAYTCYIITLERGGNVNDYPLKGEALQQLSIKISVFLIFKENPKVLMGHKPSANKTSLS